MAVGKPAWYEEGQGGTDLDAMGNDKRRSVIGRQYGASARKRLLVYGIAVTVIVLVGCGCLSLDRCKLANPDDRAAGAGPGPRYWISGPPKS